MRQLAKPHQPTCAPHHETSDSCARFAEPCGRPLAATPPVRRTVARYGFLDDLMDKLDGGADKDDAWKDEMMREQQAILASRRASGGFITEAQEEEIRQRRAKVGEEEDRLKAIQQSREKDNLEQWQAARDSGAIKTASSGMKRDADSSRMGSAGLFAERADAKMPYIDRGYVQETTSDGIPIKKKAGEQLLRRRTRSRVPVPFEKKEASAPAPAPAPAPAAPELPNPLRRLLRQAQNSRTGAGARAPGAEPFEAFDGHVRRRQEPVFEHESRRRRVRTPPPIAVGHLAFPLDTQLGDTPSRSDFTKLHYPTSMAPGAAWLWRTGGTTKSSAGAWTSGAGGLISGSPSLPEKWDS